MEPGARSQEPGARSQEPGARSREPGGADTRDGPGRHAHSPAEIEVTEELREKPTQEDGSTTAHGPEKLRAVEAASEEGWRAMTPRGPASRVWTSWERR